MTQTATLSAHGEWLKSEIETKNPIMNAVLSNPKVIQAIRWVHADYCKAMQLFHTSYSTIPQFMRSSLFTAAEKSRNQAGRTSTKLTRSWSNTT
jgi:hypothetical protein